MESGEKRRIGDAMNQIIIRNLDDIIIQKLKLLAWQNGRSFDDMARLLLVEAVRSRSARRPLAAADSPD
jgi:plasmid stability protein